MNAITTRRVDCGMPLIVESIPGVKSVGFSWLLPAGTATEPGDPTSASAATPGTDDTGLATQADSGETTAGVLTTTSPTTLSTGPDEPNFGDGLVDVGEECDDGNDNPSDTCSNTCTKVPCDQQEGNPQELLSFIWIANSSQGTVSKIETLSAANSGVYGSIQAVG